MLFDLLSFQNTSNNIYSSPFHSMGQAATPRDFRTALEYVEHLWVADDTFRQGVNRISSYFLTDVQVSDATDSGGLDSSEQKKYHDYLEDTLFASSNTKRIYNELMVYGNSFVSLIVPIRRLMRCPKCGSIKLLMELAHDPDANFRYNFSSVEFLAKCPKCSRDGTWGLIDVPGNIEEDLKIKLWNPKHMELRVDPYSETTEYCWRIPNQEIEKLRRGEPLFLANAPQEYLKAAAKNKVYRFKKDRIFHAKADVLSGLAVNGWGFPQALLGYAAAWYTASLRRINEAIGLDHLVPFRLLTPDDGSHRTPTGQGPITGYDMGEFRTMMQQIIRQHRRDPAGYHISPFTVKYQTIGGDASQMVAPEYLQNAEDRQLNGINLPPDMYRGTLRMEAAPVALRLFEATWEELPKTGNRFLAWLVTSLQQLLGWEPVKARYQRVTIADDFNKQMARLQLAASGDMSRTNSMRGLNVDWEEEKRRQSDEAIFEARLQKELQERMESEALGQMISQTGDPMMALQQGGMAPGGAPPQGGAASPPAGGDPAAVGGAPMAPAALSAMIPTGATPSSMDEIESLADQIAQQAVSMPAPQRESQLRELKQKNEVVHSVVLQKMKSIRNQAELAGRQMILGG